MFHRIFVTAAFALMLTCGSVVAADAAQAQEEAMAAAMAAMADQPALTQADIDAYVAIAPKIAAAGADQAALLQVYQDSGMDANRIGVVSTKVSIGLMLSQGMTRDQLAASGQVPEFMMPDDEEAALIQQNMPAIMQAMMGAAQ